MKIGKEEEKGTENPPNHAARKLIIRAATAIARIIDT